MWADANIVKMVFIINDTDTETYLMTKGGGTWSRLATPILVNDLSNEDAVDFLKSPYLMEQDQLAAQANPRTGRTMDDELAGRIVALVGGRILQLIAMKRDWLDGVSFDDSADELKKKEERRRKIYLP